MEEQLTVKPKLKFLNRAIEANGVGLIRTKIYQSKRKIECKQAKKKKTQKKL